MQEFCWFFSPLGTPLNAHETWNSIFPKYLAPSCISHQHRTLGVHFKKLIKSKNGAVGNINLFLLSCTFVFRLYILLWLKSQKTNSECFVHRAQEREFFAINFFLRVLLIRLGYMLQPNPIGNESDKSISQDFINEKFRKPFYFFTCILPDYVSNESLKEY